MPGKPGPSRNERSVAISFAVGFRFSGLSMSISSRSPIQRDRLLPALAASTRAQCATLSSRVMVTFFMARTP